MREWIHQISVKFHYWLSNDAVIEQVQAVASKSSYALSGATIIFGFNAEEWGIIFGMIGAFLGFATFVFNIWFRMKYGRGEKKNEKK